MLFQRVIDGNTVESLINILHPVCVSRSLQAEPHSAVFVSVEEKRKLCLNRVKPLKLPRAELLD